MAPLGLKVTLFHLFFIPLVWATVLYLAARFHYCFSAIELLWMTVDLVAAFLFRIVVTMELLWGVEIALLRLPSDYGRKVALSAVVGIFYFFNRWTFYGATLLLIQRMILTDKLLVQLLHCCGLTYIVDLLAGGEQCWCCLMFLLIGYYELFAFLVLASLRMIARLRADQECTKLQTHPERVEPSS